MRTLPAAKRAGFILAYLSPTYYYSRSHPRLYRMNSIFTRLPGSWHAAPAAARAVVARFCGVAAILTCAACDGPQSTLTPAGSDAEDLGELFRVMLWGAALIWLGVMVIAVYVSRARRGRHERGKALALIVGGGAVIPVITLTALLIYGLQQLRDGRMAQADPGLRIQVSGEQWWWRVRYLTADGKAVDSANEVRLPLGQRVAFELSSPDVIHSFWIPALGGKMDMIPGRVNRMTLRATKTGVYRGVCAEYCGTSHALMAFGVEVMRPDAFAEWLEQEAEPADEPTGSVARRGRDLFHANGCAACHAVRGTPADGAIGPDLTHVGSRHTLGAGILPNDVAGFSRWIQHTAAVKPDVHMPSFDMLSEEEIRALATYLDGLE